MKIVHLSENQENKEERFLEFLYDERFAEGTICIPAAQLRTAGGINSRLKAKRQYELLLRFADSWLVEITEAPECPFGYVELKEENTALDWEGLRTDCYVVSRYRNTLIKHSCFNEVVGSVLEAAGACGLRDKTVGFLEEMLKRGEEYYQIDDAVQPILIYKGEDICYNVLNVFAEQFGEALMRAGKNVEYFDSESEENQALTRYIGKHYQAVIGMQTYLFSIKMKDDQTYLHDLIHAPIYNFVFDHPIWVKPHMLQSPKKLVVLTLDLNYVRFCERYYHRKAYLFPPSGKRPNGDVKQKVFSVSFVGSYGDYWNEAMLIHSMERNMRFIANRFLLKMRKNPKLTSEEAFRQTLDEKRIRYTDREYTDIFFAYKRVVCCVMYYYRVKVIKTLLEAGMTVDVFGNSWANCALAVYPNLVCHPDVTVEQSLEVFLQSKISLNIMAWHKGGFTERMANIMLCKAVLVTDDTSYLDGRFCRGMDLLAFQLDELEKLPGILKEYLKNDEKREKVASSGYEKALEYHTWDCRAHEFLNEMQQKPG